MTIWIGWRKEDDVSVQLFMARRLTAVDQSKIELEDRLKSSPPAAVPLTSHSSSCQQSATRLSTHPRRFNPHRVWRPYIVHFFYKQNIHALCILSTPVLYTREPARGSFISLHPKERKSIIKAESMTNYGCGCHSFSVGLSFWSSTLAFVCDKIDVLK